MSTAKKRHPDRLDRYVSMLKQKQKDATGSEPAASPDKLDQTEEDTHRHKATDVACLQ